jgi:acyl carrier protein
MAAPNGPSLNGAVSLRRHRIIDYVTDELLADPDMGLDEHEEILASGRIDSIGVMRLVSFIQDEFSITIPGEDLVLDNFRSIHAIDAYLSTHEGA